MKRLFWMFAIAAVAFAGCSKDTKTKKPGSDVVETEGLKEMTLTVNVNIPVAATLNDVPCIAEIPGDKILSFYDMTADEFYKAMGTLVGDTDAFTHGQTSQEDNTIMFGIAQANDTDDLLWVPASSNNFGHWVNDKAEMTAWAEQEALGNFYLATENQCEFGLDSDYDKELANMWKFRIFLSGTEDLFPIGETFKMTEVFYQVLDDEFETEVLCYIVWNFKFTSVEKRDIETIDTVKYETTIEYNDEYAPTVVEYDYASIASKLGVAKAFDCDIYWVDPEGNFSEYPSVDNWFDAEGYCSGWGDDAVVDLKYDTEVDENAFSIFCMPYNSESQTAADKCGTFTVRNAFVNEDYQAVVFEATITVVAPAAGGDVTE